MYQFFIVIGDNSWQFILFYHLWALMQTINTCSCCYNISWNMVFFISMVNILSASLPISADSCRFFPFPRLVILLCTFNTAINLKYCYAPLIKISKLKILAACDKLNGSNVNLANFMLSMSMWQNCQSDQKTFHVVLQTAVSQYLILSHKF